MPKEGGGRVCITMSPTALWAWAQVTQPAFLVALSRVRAQKRLFRPSYVCPSHSLAQMAQASNSGRGSRELLVVAPAGQAPGRRGWRAASTRQPSPRRVSKTYLDTFHKGVSIFKLKNALKEGNAEEQTNSSHPKHVFSEKRCSPNWVIVEEGEEEEVFRSRVAAARGALCPPDTRTPRTPPSW